jgi:hypothetical protein
MNSYDIYLHREILITFRDVKAESPEDAAGTACGFATNEIDSVVDCDNLSARVDVADGDGYHRPVTIDFQPERLRRAAPALLAACRMVVERWERGDLAEAARACSAAVAEAENVTSPACGDPANKSYSVLLLYPDHVNDSGRETCYAFVEAADPIEAVATAQRQAVAAHEGIDFEPEDFQPLLVTEGHHYSEPLFNK